MDRLAETEFDFEAFSILVFGTKPHAGQSRFEHDKNGQVNFLLPGNSWGKTEHIARVILWEAWFKKGYDFWREDEDGEYFDFDAWYQQRWLGLVASYEYDIAQESFDRLKQYKRNRPEVAALISRLSESDYEMDLTNNAHVDWGSLSENGKHVEAKRYVRIKVDEAGHIPDLAYTYDSILYPRTLGVGGVIDLFGTPKLHSDPYLFEVYEKGRDGGDGFYYSQSGSVLENEYWSDEERERVFKNPRYVLGWDECEDPETCSHALHLNGRTPRLSPMGRQVLLGEFIIAGSLFFNRHAIARMFAWETEKWGEPEWVDENNFSFEPVEGHLYFGAWDLGGNKKRTKKKQGSDPTVGFVIDYTEKPWKVVRYTYVPGGDADWQRKYDLMQADYEDFSLPYLIIDATGQLDSVQEALYDRGVEVLGVHFGGTGSKKFDMLRNLQLITELEWGGQRGALRCPPIPKVRYELEHYRLPDEDISQDTVMALAMLGHELAQNELPEAVSGEVY